MDREQLTQKIIDLIEPITAMHSAELVRVKLFGSLSKVTVQIMAERPDATMDLGLCETLSREYSLILDVNDLIPSEYVLEVSSPGIDRPLTRKKDFERWYGFEVVADLKEKYLGRRKLKGILQQPQWAGDTDKLELMIQEDTGCFTVPLDMVAEIKMTLTDDLLKATQNGAKLHGFAYDEMNAEQLSTIEIEIDDKEKIKNMAKKNKPKKIEEIEEEVVLNSKED